MKKLLAFGLLVSTLGLAADVKVGHQAHPVRVDSVQVEAVGTGFPVTRVSVRATFGNKCLVPRESELISIAQHADDYRTLILTVGEEILRACPMVYQPTTVTIQIGDFTKPNDGLFSKIIVNGKEAK